MNEGASILVQSPDGELAYALGVVIGNAVQKAGFHDVNVMHCDDIDVGSECVPQMALEDGPSLLQQMKLFNPNLFDARINITSSVAEVIEEDDQPSNEDLSEEDELPLDDEAAAHLAEIAHEGM